MTVALVKAILRFLFPVLLLFCFNLSVANSDVVATFSSSGADTQVTVTGELDFTGAGILMSTFSPVFSVADTATRISDGVEGVISYAYDVDAFVGFGTAPDFNQISTSSVMDGFILNYVDRSPGGTGFLRDVVTLPTPFGQTVTHTIVGQTFASLGLTPGDVWGIEIPLLFGDGTPIDPVFETQSLTFVVVPEPCSLGILFGLGAFTLRRRRR